MKYLILFGLIYVAYKFNTWKSQLGSVNEKENSKINKTGAAKAKAKANAASSYNVC